MPFSTAKFFQYPMILLISFLFSPSILSRVRIGAMAVNVSDSSVSNMTLSRLKPMSSISS